MAEFVYCNAASDTLCAKNVDQFLYYSFVCKTLEEKEEGEGGKEEEGEIVSAEKYEMQLF